MSHRSNLYLKEYDEYRKNTLSDSPVSTDDYLYSNSKMMSIYGHGKGFHVEDNLVLYEVVKLIREIIDKHYYKVQIGFRADVGHRKAVFHFFFNKRDNEYEYLSSTLQEFVFTKIAIIYDDYFITTKREINLGKNNVELEITVKINDHEEE